MLPVDFFLPPVSKVNSYSIHQKGNQQKYDNSCGRIDKEFMLRPRHPVKNNHWQNSKLIQRAFGYEWQAALWSEVKDKLNKSAFSLSGGQQQRLCIARTLAVKPSIILMDEPAASLDPISTSKIEELIAELKEDYTIVIVTHNMQQAARVSDKTGFFYLGELIEYDKTKDLFTSPKEKKTENYITGRFG